MSVSALDRFRVDGRSALVTGGSRGLGLEIADALAQAGAGVTLLARRAEFFDDALERLPGAHAVVGDVRSEADVAMALDEAGRAHGPVEILVNAAGITWGAPSMETPIEKVREVLDVNVTGTYIACQLAGRSMRDRGYGKIVNVSSVAGLAGGLPELLDTVGYTASKGGVNALTRELAVKWAPFGIRVNALAPGFFPTRMTERVLARVGPAIEGRIPLGRVGREGELAGAALFLASPASDYVTGHVLVVDGGLVAGGG